ncbi:MAG TPA: hypothetical protein VFQ61_11650 [Polyangiaceae bacterium]|nr:hypothetical protein [Polyangiaceae bacterium]
MFSKLLLLGLLGLLLTKVSLRTHLRELGKKLDRVVNATLIAIVIVYFAQLLYMWLGSRP